MTPASRTPGPVPVTKRTAGRTTVRLFVRPALRRLGSRWLVRGWLAITVGTTIVSWRRLEPPELAHELEHVRQWRRHGCAGYVLRYGLASVRARLAGGDWYRDNVFEHAARDAAFPARGDSARGDRSRDTNRHLSRARAAPRRRP